MNSNKILYFQLQQAQSLPLYMQSWWLDAVCGAENWDVCLALDKVGEPQGALVYHHKRKFGQSFILQPLLTQHSGVWVRYPILPMKTHSRIQFDYDILNELIAQLPKVLFSLQQYQLTTCLPFIWQDFQQTTRYTYVIQTLDNLTITFQNFNRNIKRNIKKASSEIRIFETDEVAVLYDLTEKSLQKNKAKMPYNVAFLEKIYLAAKEKKQGKIYVAQGNNEQNLAACMVIYDADTAYYLVAGADYSQDSASLTGLVWRAIQDAAALGLKNFDFTGSMLPFVVPFNRSFGATQIPYFRLTKAKNKFWKVVFNSFFS